MSGFGRQGYPDNIIHSFRNGANGFMIKPVREDAFDYEMAKLGLIPSNLPSIL
jgi:hypothetical protein